MGEMKYSSCIHLKFSMMHVSFYHNDGIAVDTKKLALMTPGFTGAEIENIVNIAITRAINQDKYNTLLLIERVPQWKTLNTLVIGS